MNIEWVQFVLWNTAFCPRSAGMIKTYYCFTSDVMYERYKRLVYTHPDLLTRFYKVNLSNAKKLAWVFLPLINLRWSRAIMALKCDRRWLPVFKVHIRLSTRCKIWFTLGLFSNYFSLKSGSLSLKSHINVL